MQKVERIHYQYRNTKESSSGRKKIPAMKERIKNTVKSKICV